MRIIGGEFKGRRLRTVSGLSVRPTSDRLRETLFNILGSRVQDSQFLDVCAGSGAVGLEALSRGAAAVTFVERSPRALSAIEENLRANRVPTGPDARARLLKGDAARTIAILGKRAEKFDIVFFDPPYESGIYEQVMTQLGRGQILSPHAIVVVEHRSSGSPAEAYGSLQMYRQVKQGDSALSMFAVT
jgi:16S rRNA (guanine(966)-N(2))-methyltransferase RsmD